MDVDVDAQVAENDWTLKPSNESSSVDTSDWPLLLKNHSDLLVRTNHFTNEQAGWLPWIGVNVFSVSDTFLSISARLCPTEA